MRRFDAAALRKGFRCAQAIICLLALCMLGGCAEPLRERRPPELPLEDEISIRWEAPKADYIADRTMQAVLHYLTEEGMQMRTYVQTVTVRGGQHEAEAVLRALLGNSAPQGVRALSPDIQLAEIAHPVVVAEHIGTVYLTAGARLLSPKDFFAARMVIVNTLTELSDISYVNILVEGREEGIDLANTIPCGTLTRLASGELDSPWRQLELQQEQQGNQGFTKLVTIYTPAPGGKFLLPQVRTATFDDAKAETLALGVLMELSKGGLGRPDTPVFPDLTQYLSGAPELLQQVNESARVLRLNFRQDLQHALTQSGVSKGMLCGALTKSLVPFIPYIKGVQIRLGADAVIELTAEETLDGQSIVLPGDIWTPELFDEVVGAFAYIALPTQGEGGLVRCSRPVQATSRWSPRTLLQTLAQGAQPSDIRTDVIPAIPHGASAEDVLAIHLQGDMALVNLSQRFADVCAQLEGNAERDTVYAIVNTLTENRQVRRVAFFVEGQQVKSLTGQLEMRGFFLRNPGLMQ